MKTKSFVPTTALLAAALLVAAVSVVADDCDYTDPREAVIDAAGATLIAIDAAAGSLRVEGRDGLTEVRASGEACASRKSLLEDIRIETRRTGDTVRIIAEMPTSLRSGNARLDLVVEVPADIPLDVEDSSGEMKIRHVAALEINDSSGEIVVEDVTGDLRIREDSSGEIEVIGVTGNVHIEEDSSGEIDIRKVGGSVIIDEDSSGEIDVADVEGDVIVHRDSSGSISVRNVGGDFTVDHDGSGDIRHQEVAGRVSIPEDD